MRGFIFSMVALLCLSAPVFAQQDGDDEKTKTVTVQIGDKISFKGLSCKVLDLKNVIDDAKYGTSDKGEVIVAKQAVLYIKCQKMEQNVHPLYQVIEKHGQLSGGTSHSTDETVSCNGAKYVISLVKVIPKANQMVIRITRID